MLSFLVMCWLQASLRVSEATRYSFLFPIKCGLLERILFRSNDDLWCHTTDIHTAFLSYLFLNTLYTLFGYSSLNLVHSIRKTEKNMKKQHIIYSAIIFRIMQMYIKSVSTYLLIIRHLNSCRCYRNWIYVCHLDIKVSR